MNWKSESESITTSKAVAEHCLRSIQTGGRLAAPPVVLEKDYINFGSSLYYIKGGITAKLTANTVVTKQQPFKNLRIIFFVFLLPYLALTLVRR